MVNENTIIHVMMTQSSQMKITANECSLYTKQKDKAKFNTAEEEYEYASKTEKICSKCGLVKSLNDYAGNTSGCDAFNKYGYRLRRPECKVCSRNSLQGKQDAVKLAKKMGISHKAPEGTICAICGNLGKKGDGLVFDHCHKTNIFRGYIHNSCNRSIGVLGDNVKKILNVVNFLNKTEKCNFIQDKDTGELIIRQRRNSF